MSFFKELGSVLGGTVGYVLGKPIEKIGEATDLKLLEEIGAGVQKSSQFAGETLGGVTGGAVNTVRGMVTDDPYLRDEGLADMGEAVEKTAKGVVHTVKGVASNGASIIEGVLTEDKELLKKGAAGIATTAAVGALAFGVVDVVDGVDASTDVTTTDSSSNLDVDGNLHHVDAHYVEGYVRADGTVVDGYLRDGDGDTSVHQSEGYDRTNPDDVKWNNIG